MADEPTGPDTPRQPARRPTRRPDGASAAPPRQQERQPDEPQGPPHAELDQLLGAMARGDASDLFVCEGKPPAIRKHGAVRSLGREPTTTAALDALLDAALSDDDRRLFRQHGELDVGWTRQGPDGPQRFRLAFSHQRGPRGPARALVARCLPSARLRFEDLGLPAAVRAFADLPRGFVLVTGATGAGKSTTLAAMVHRINTTRRVHIVTIEDPIEFVHEDALARVSQREVGRDTPSYAAALRHALRESPDVLVLGELRDASTTAVAIEAALTGHLVLATLHTVDATQTVQRILAQFPRDQHARLLSDLALSLGGVVSQRLLPQADGAGRVLAAEVLTCTPPVRQLLREERVEELVDLMATSRDPAIVPFNRALLDLHERGLITYELGLAYATNPEEFVLAARGVRAGADSFSTAAAPRPTGAATHAPSPAPPPRLDLKALLLRALTVGASDLHLAVGRPPIYRVAGTLYPLPPEVMAPLTAADLRALLYAVMTVRQRAHYELERELDFAIQVDDKQRFRVNAYHQKGRMAAALRAIPTRIPSFDELRVPAGVIELVDRPHGLLLVVGPTGAGKTTTLAALVDHINRTRACRIITVEDPIEYVHEGARATVDQREVGSDTADFASALRYILRQDPDVILIGELRDHETVSAALTAAETGHLVLATLHANDAIQTIERLIDVFPSAHQPQIRAMLSGSLLGVVSQRLLPRADGRGRVPAFELLLATPAIRNLIRESKMHQARAAMDSGRSLGMRSLDESLRRLYQEDLVTYEDALRFATDPATLTRTG